MAVDLRENAAKTPVSNAGKVRRTVRRGTPRLPLVDAVLVLGLIGAVYALARIASLWSAPLQSHVEIQLGASAIPGYALASVMRMAAAYVLSLVFSLAYGRADASGAWAERLLMSLLDILQSIPILSFMPGVVLALVVLFPSNNVGLELAAILLIFTSQAWNLAFRFYQSVRTVPSDLREAAVINHLSAWQRFTKLEVPFATIGLVWNSMMSWAGGWFFLMAAEQFTLESIALIRRIVRDLESNPSHSFHEDALLEELQQHFSPPRRADSWTPLLTGAATPSCLRTTTTPASSIWRKTSPPTSRRTEPPRRRFDLLPHSPSPGPGRGG